jgi:hypothetical protein
MKKGPWLNIDLNYWTLIDFKYPILKINHPSLKPQKYIFQKFEELNKALFEPNLVIDKYLGQNIWYFR